MSNPYSKLKKFRWFKDCGFTPLEKAADFSRRLSSDKADGSLMPPSAPLENLFLTGSAQTVRGLSFLTGFTLVEIMLVVVIIGALASMIIPRLTGRTEQAKQTAARADIEAHLATALKLYELDNGNFPTTNQGLDALMKKSSTSPIPPNWNGPYIERKPIDPWGRLYNYASPGEHRPDYDIYSKGKDETKEDDDVTNW